MGFQVSPGVRITEKDLTTIIPAVATTPAGMVIHSQWGPANYRVIVTNENDMYLLFGPPNNNTFQYFFTASNFLQYGNNLSVVRGISGALNSVAGNTGNAQGVVIENPDKYEFLNTTPFSGVTSGAFFAAKYPGDFGNSLRIEICDGTAAFNVWGLSGQFSAAPTISQYLAGLGVTNTNDEMHVAIIDQEGVFSGVKESILETYEGLSKATDARKSDGSSNFYRTVIAQNSKYVYPLNNIQGINVKRASDPGTFGLINATASQPGFSSQFAAGSTAGLYLGKFNGGVVDTAVSQSQIASLYNFYYGDPDTTEVSLLLGGPLTGSAAATVGEVAKSRKDCVAFFSAPNFNPSSATVDTDSYNRAIELRNAIGNNSYAFIDSSYKYMYDRYNDINRWVPLNGDIAGLCARTDEVADPWFSPAGFNRGNIRNVIKLGWNPNQTYRDMIYPKGINPVVTFPGEGTVLYGDKTAQTRPSAFDRINVRRLFIILEKAIAIASKYQLFEFNDAFTRSMFVSMVEPYLRDVQARRGIFDFKVICDDTNNPPEIVDSNRFVADIYIKPARSINFISLNFIATRTGVNFEEIASLSIPGQ